jgi:hypothetical protein
VIGRRMEDDTLDRGRSTGVVVRARRDHIAGVGAEAQ